MIPLAKTYYLKVVALAATHKLITVCIVFLGVATIVAGTTQLALSHKHSSDGVPGTTTSTAKNNPSSASSSPAKPGNSSTNSSTSKTTKPSTTTQKSTGSTSSAGTGGGAALNPQSGGSTSGGSTTTPSATVPCLLTTAAESCWAAHTGVPGYTESQILAGQSNLTHVTSQATAPSGTTYSGGNLTIHTNGAVIDHVWLDGCISIYANNVTISNSLIHTNGHTCAGGDGQSAGSGVNSGGCSGGAGTVTGTFIKDSEVDAGQGTVDYVGIGAGNYHLLRVNMHGGTKNAWAGCNVTIEESYGHSLTPNAGSIHEDVIDADTSVFVTVKHTWLSAVGGNATTGAMVFNASWGTAHDGTVTNCFLQGGPGADAVFNAGQYNMKITGNAFSSNNGWGGTDFFYGYTPSNSGNVWSGNYIPETGKTLNADGSQT